MLEVPDRHMPAARAGLSGAFYGAGLFPEQESIGWYKLIHKTRETIAVFRLSRRAFIPKAHAELVLAVELAASDGWLLLTVDFEL